MRRSTYSSVGHAAAGRPQAANSLIAQGDALYAERGDYAKAKEARTKYENALAAGEDAYEANWKLSRVCYWIGDHTGAKDLKKTVLLAGVEYAKILMY